MFARALATARTALAALTLVASSGRAQNVTIASLLAADRNAAERSLRDGAGPALYLTICRRLPDGSVRYIADGGNPRPPTP